MERFKTQINLGAAVHEAALVRMSDQDFETFTLAERNQRAGRYLSNPLVGSAPAMTPGGVMSGLEFNRWFKDSKFVVHLINLQLGILEDGYAVESRDLQEVVDEASQELYRLQANTIELERQSLNRFSVFHHNSFVRTEDQDSRNIKWGRDWKVERPLPRHSPEIIPGVGMTDGIKSRTIIPISGVEIVGETTDAGTVLVETSPTNLLIPGKTFRYVTVHAEHDRAGNPLVRSTALLKLNLRFSSMVMLNRIELTPVSAVPFELSLIRFQDETGVEQTLDIAQFLVEGKSVMLFAPLKARSVQLEFQQIGVVSRGEVAIGDALAAELNQIVNGLGWVQSFPEISETVSGAVHDFSMESIKAYLIEYHPTTVMTGRTLKADKPVGLRWDVTNQELDLPTTVQTFGSEYVGGSLQESYLGIEKLDVKDNVLGSVLIPLKDSSPQLEYLVGNGIDARVKLFPNLRATLVPVRVVGCTTDGVTATITTDTAHGFVPGDTVGFYGNGVLNGTFTVDTAATTIEFTILTAESVTITLNSTPYLWCYSMAFADPATVYENGVALTLGSGYQVSLDAGATWLDSWPVQTEYDQQYLNAKAGQFRVKLLNPKYHLPYWIEYTVLANQLLDTGGSVVMKNGRILLSGYSRVAVTPVLINRINQADPYHVTVTKNYNLGILSAE